MTAKDYFEDITPPDDVQKRGPSKVPPPEPKEGGMADTVKSVPINRAGPEPAPRGIRNISAPRPRPAGRPALSARPDLREAPPVFGGEPPERPRRSRWWLWGLAAVLVLALAALALVALRSTTVTVTPKSHDVVFDQSSSFTAYPEASAATGTLAYSVQISDLEDSEAVQSQGTTHAETKASGSIIVYNEYSAQSVKLIKNTRFETPEGLVFRTPAEVVIPGKKGSTPGQVSITVAADQAGEKYNVGPVSRFTLPGLKSSPDMYKTVYAKSVAAMTGGFVGEQPAVAPGALEAALSAVRTRLEAKARDAINAQRSETAMVFPELAQITYQELPRTAEAGGGVRIHEKAHVVVPVFASRAFAETVARAVSADAEGAAISLVPGDGFTASMTGTSIALGSQSFTFKLSGQAQLLWKVDTAALAEALAGRDQDAFQTIVNGFSGIQEAHARIEPFWKSTFPSSPADIKVDVKASAAAR